MKVINAISTYVATVILVVLAVGLGTMLFLYFSGYFSGMTGTAEKQQQEIFECVGARLDMDYYYGGEGNLTIRLVNVGNINLGKSFSIKIDIKNGVSIYKKIALDQELLPGSDVTINLTGMSGSVVTKITVTPLDKCQIPFSRIKEVEVPR